MNTLESAPEQTGIQEIGEREQALENLKLVVIQAVDVCKALNKEITKDGSPPIDLSGVAESVFVDGYKKINADYPPGSQELSSDITSGNDDHSMNDDYNVPAAA